MVDPLSTDDEFGAMPEEKTDVFIQGHKHEAVLVPVTASSEHFNEYILADGSALRIKTVVTEVSRILNLHDLEGNPVYAVKTQNVMVVRANEDLRKKGG